MVMIKKEKKAPEKVNAFQQVIESNSDNDNKALNENAKEAPAKDVKEATDLINVDKNTLDRG